MVRGRHTTRPSAGFKRKRSGYAVRPFKRRRLSYGRKTTNWTSQNGTGGGLRFRSRKIRRSRWRSMLWNNSLQKDHYRTLLAGSSTANTPATTTTMTVTGFDAMRINSNNFYVAAGGAVNPDGGQSLPVFTGKFTVRGGKLGLRLVNTFDTTASNQNTLHGTVYLVKTSKLYTSAVWPATVYTGWDPSYIQDFPTAVGRIVYRKDFLLRDADTSLIEYRLKPSLIDPSDYINSRNQFVWVLILGNVDVASARTFSYTQYYNMSFVADAV